MTTATRREPNHRKKQQKNLEHEKDISGHRKAICSRGHNLIKNEVENAGNQLVLLEKYTEKAQLLEAVADADALIVRSDKVTPEVLEAAKNLKIVVRAGAGYDSIDTAYAKEKGIVVENTPGQNANAVAELVFGLLVYAVRNFYNGKSAPN